MSLIFLRVQLIAGLELCLTKRFGNRSLDLARKSLPVPYLSPNCLLLNQYLILEGSLESKSLSSWGSACSMTTVCPLIANL
jgi:hypothetical protein